MGFKAETIPIRENTGSRAAEGALCAMTRALQYRPALIRYFQRRSALLASEAEDLAQEVFLRLWQRSQSAEIDRVEGYFFKVASSVMIDRARWLATRRGADHLNFEESVHSSHLSITPDRVLEGRHDIETVAAALQRLPESARNAFIFSRFEEMTYPEIAKGMGVSVSSVEKYIMRALREITAALDAAGNESGKPTA